MKRKFDDWAAEAQTQAEVIMKQTKKTCGLNFLYTYTSATVRHDQIGRHDSTPCEDWSVHPGEDRSPLVSAQLY